MELARLVSNLTILWCDLTMGLSVLLERKVSIYTSSCRFFLIILGLCGSNILFTTSSNSLKRVFETDYSRSCNVWFNYFDARDLFRVTYDYLGENKIYGSGIAEFSCINCQDVFLNLVVSPARNFGDFFGEFKYMLVSLKLTFREGIEKREDGLCSLVIP